MTVSTQEGQSNKTQPKVRVRDDRSFRLPNGLRVFGLNRDDTVMVYRDIFEEDCYRQHGVKIEDGDCILDVGANTGLFVLFLNHCLSRAKVYSFEPAPATFQVLRRNVEKHDKLAVQLFNAGLSQQTGQAELTFYPRMSNASTFHPDESQRAVLLGRNYVLDRFRQLPWPLSTLLAVCPLSLRTSLADRVRKFYLKKQSVTCEVWTLSDFLQKQGIERVDLLKVDAEQSEQAILAGLKDDDWRKVRQIIVEVHDGEEATQAMVDMLGLRGFQIAVEPNPTFPSLSLVYGRRAA